MCEGVQYATVVTESKYNTCFIKAETTPHERDREKLVWVMSGQAHGVNPTFSAKTLHALI